METAIREEAKDFEKLYEGALQKIERGDVKKGKILSIKNDCIVVDIGFKSEGTILISEFSSEELLSLREGDEIEVYVERINDHDGIVTLSKDRALKIKAWERLSESFQNNERVEGRVTEKTKGGLIVDVMGLKAFLPSSQIDIKGVRDVDSFIGQTFPLRILKLIPPKMHQDSGSKSSTTSLIVSRRAIIEEDRKEKREKTLSVLHVDMHLTGTVKNITDYGVFVDLGGIDGLLHISDISWGRVTHPSEYFNIGDEKEFIVLKFDPDTQKVTLGYKQKKQDPWLSVDEKYRPGMQVKGRIVTITDYGVFVEVEEGLEGLVHVSEIDWVPRPKHPSKYFSVNEEVDAYVLNANKEERRLSLSIKMLRPKPWEQVGQRYSVGQRIKGRVKTLTDFGAFVRLPEGVDGLIHISDISWTKHIKHPSEILRKGQRVEAVVLTMEPEKERMALGIKQIVSDPWRDEIPAKFKLGDQVRGKVLRNTDFGLFIELDGGVEGLVYSSEIDNSRPLQEDEEVKVRIIKINADERKIGLSMKNITAYEG